MPGHRNDPPQPAPPRHGFVDLLAVSFLILFFELVLIRWISCNIRIVAYFSNVILISCFLGFGIGCVLRSRRDLFPLFPFVVLLITLLCRYLAESGIANPYETEFVFGDGGRHDWLSIVPLVFVSNAAAFVALGQRLARTLDRFPPLRGYSMSFSESGSWRLMANDDYHQLALNLTEDWARQIPGLRGWQRTYDLPYRILGRPPRNVLVLGAGVGNDVAAALRNGASAVKALELDPLILRLGRDRRPYGDSRVSVEVTDARRFLGKGRGTFDMVVLGWLDSHRLFSSLSNVRQDNFVYTVESMRQVRGILEPDGVLCLSFFVGKPWVGSKIFRMLREAFA